MKEVKSPKKPLIYYYGVAILVIFLFNMIVSPLLMKGQIKEVDYGTFMSMIEDKNIGEVQIDDSQIVFTDKDNQQIYETGAMNDPTLTQRLYDCGAKFTKEVEQAGSPLLNIFLTVILPLLIFIGLGQYMSRKLIEQAGGKDALSFGMGKSNAKVYVQSTQGIHFNDVAGEDEAKENLKEIVDYLHNPDKYLTIQETGKNLIRDTKKRRCTDTFCLIYFFTICRLRRYQFIIIIYCHMHIKDSIHMIIKFMLSGSDILSQLFQWMNIEFVYFQFFFLPL